MNIPASFSPNSQDFQLRDFAKMISFMSYSFILSFLATKSAIFLALRERVY